MILFPHNARFEAAELNRRHAVVLASLRKAFSATVVTLFCLEILLSMSLAQSANPAPANFAPFAGAVISEWKGAVQVQLPNSPAARPVHGQVLPAGTLLDTKDGQMMLVLRSDESEILVQPHTRLTLQEPKPGSWDTLQVLLGKVRTYIRKRTGGAPPFEMGTPSAVIAVRGTRFDVEVNKTGVSEIDVFEGLVEVGSATRSGKSVLLGPGMSTRVSVGGAPETPVPTREIRPDVEVPDRMARTEFSREQALQADRPSGGQMGDRPDTHNGGDHPDQNHNSDHPDHPDH